MLGLRPSQGRRSLGLYALFQNGGLDYHLPGVDHLGHLCLLLESLLQIYFLSPVKAGPYRAASSRVFFGEPPQRLFAPTQRIILVPEAEPLLGLQ